MSHLVDIGLCAICLRTGENSWTLTFLCNSGGPYDCQGQPAGSTISIGRQVSDSCGPNSPCSWTVRLVRGTVFTFQARACYSPPCAQHRSLLLYGSHLPDRNPLLLPWPSLLLGHFATHVRHSAHSGARFVRRRDILTRRLRCRRHLSDVNYPLDALLRLRYRLWFCSRTPIGPRGRDQRERRHSISELQLAKLKSDTRRSGRDSGPAASTCPSVARERPSPAHAVVDPFSTGPLSAVAPIPASHALDLLREQPLHRV